MVAREVVGGELCRNATPAKREARADHRHHRTRSPKRAQYVREHAGQAQRDQHDCDRQRLARVMCVARRGAQRGSEDAEHDRGHREVLVAPGALPQHALADHQQNQQTRGKRRLHNHQGGEQKRDDL